MASKSVYNFVPAPIEDNVFKPEWTDAISMEIPFEDSQSGEIEIEIEALSPIFVRNGQGKEVEDNSFSHYVDKEGVKHYFIPGTSLKGMVRNVLEIMTKSRLNRNLVNDDRYSYRDLTSDSLYMQNYHSNDVHCGWLKEDNEGKWTIEDCGRPYLMKHDEIDFTLFIDESSGLEYTYSTDNKKDNIAKDAISKYKFIISKSKMMKCMDDFQDQEKSIPYTTNHEELSKQDKARRIVMYDEESDTKGFLVVTGQVGKVDYDTPRKNPGKYHEFIFPIKDNYVKLSVDDKVQKDFRFIYHEDQKNEESPDWKYWKERLREGKKVPVFFNVDEKTKKEVLHLGLAYMYKLPYKQSVHQVYPIKTYGIDPDFAETLFGYTNKEDSLKGRISFGHAKAINKCEERKSIKLVLGGPKASFFPYYLEQIDKPQRYNTYQDDKATLRGFKRYPTRNSLMTLDIPNENEKVKTTLTPLEKGAKFVSKVRFFNLKKEELGALLSAITFNNEVNAHHNIGMAKPFGYGKIGIKIKKIISNDCEVTNTSDTYTKAFKKMIGDLSSQDGRLKELYAMASNKDDSLLAYTEWKKFSKFKSKKGPKEILKRFSLISGEKKR